MGMHRQCLAHGILSSRIPYYILNGTKCFPILVKNQSFPKYGKPFLKTQKLIQLMQDKSTALANGTTQSYTKTIKQANKQTQTQSNKVAKEKYATTYLEINDWLHYFQ